MQKPLIITLHFDENTFDFFNKQRKKYFPADKNFLDAHLTLFHHLPSDNLCIYETVEQLCKHQSVITLHVEKLVNISNGVAYKIQAPQLSALHKHMQKAFNDWLIPQDKQKLWPHITIQNKVSNEAASALYRELQNDFIPFSISGVGFTLWEYKNGPWEFIKTLFFRL